MRTALSVGWKGGFFESSTEDLAASTRGALFYLSPKKNGLRCAFWLLEQKNYYFKSITHIILIYLKLFFTFFGLPIPKRVGFNHVSTISWTSSARNTQSI